MTRSPTMRCALLLLTCLLLGACAEKKGEDFCRDHYLFHKDHQAETGTLTISVSDDNLLIAELHQPVGAFLAEEGRLEAVIESLRDAGNVYTAGAEGRCQSRSTAVSTTDGTIIALYESRCSIDDLLKRVDVSIFDTVPEIEEVEVTIRTPATFKHFAISRQCSAAIFRLQLR